MPTDFRDNSKGGDLVPTVARKVVRDALVVVCRQVKEMASAYELRNEGLRTLQTSCRYGLAMLDLFRDFYPVAARNKVQKQITRAERNATRGVELYAVEKCIGLLCGTSTAGISTPVPKLVEADQVNLNLRQLRNTALQQLDASRQEVQRDMVKLSQKWATRQLDQAFLDFASQARWRQLSSEPTFSRLAYQRLHQEIETLRHTYVTDATEIPLFYDIRLATERIFALLQVFAGIGSASFAAELREEIVSTWQHVDKLLAHTTAQAWFTRWEHDAKNREQRTAFQRLHDLDSVRLAADFDPFMEWWQCGRMRQMLEHSDEYLSNFGSNSTNSV